MMNNENYSPDPEDDDDDFPRQYDDDDDDYYERKRKMDRDFPGYSDESKRAGLFIGLDFPYVPGDPGL